MSIQRELDEAYEAGQTACMDGFGADHNPHSHAPLLNDAWRRGYYDAIPVREQWEEACQEHWDAAR